MKRSWIYIIIGLMTMSLLGLAVIQYRYFKNTLTLKEAQFHYTVDMALAQVGQELNRHEARQRVMRDQQGRKVMQRLDSIQQVMRSGWAENKAAYCKDTVVITEDGSLKMSYTAYQSSPINSPISEQSVVGMEHTVIYNDEWLEDFLSGMFDPSLLSPMDMRLDYGFLDSITHRTFADLGIDAEVDLAIFNAHNEPLIFDETKGLAPLVALSKANHRLRIPSNSFHGPPEFLHVEFPRKDRYIMSTLWPLLLTSGSLMLIIMAAFGLTIFVIIRQKRVSEIKNDFINNMTHELKTPVSTIALACEALADPDMRKVAGSTDRYLSMIKEENARLGALVENVLQSAIVDKGELKLKKERVSLHEIILRSTAAIDLAMEKQGGKITFDLQAMPDVIQADRVHLQNVIENLLDNAMKYSLERPEICIRTKTYSQDIQLIVSDQGIGISREHQKHIFETLYRVPTGDMHDVKGFGLGLSYVKAVIEAHGGQVSVRSDLGKGTAITIQIARNGA